MTTNDDEPVKPPDLEEGALELSLAQELLYLEAKMLKEFRTAQRTSVNHTNEFVSMDRHSVHILLELLKLSRKRLITSGIDEEICSYYKNGDWQMFTTSRWKWDEGLPILNDWWRHEDCLTNMEELDSMIKELERRIKEDDRKYDFLSFDIQKHKMQMILVMIKWFMKEPRNKKKLNRVASIYDRDGLHYRFKKLEMPVDELLT